MRAPRRTRLAALFLGATLLASLAVVIPAATALATTGSNSCQGSLACQGSGDVGNNSCNGDQACQGAGNVGDNSCNVELACQGAGNVGNNSCNGDLACQGATGPIGNNSCNGDANCHAWTIAIGDCLYNAVVPADCEVHQADGLVRRSGGHLKGDGIYNADGTGQTTFNAGTRYKRGTCRSTYVYVQNDGNVAETFTFDAEALASNGFAATFYTRTPLTDVSSAVWDGTFTSPLLQPGSTYGITGRICIASDAAQHGQMHVMVTVTPNGNSNPTVTPQSSVGQDTVGFGLLGK